MNAARGRRSTTHLWTTVPRTVLATALVLPLAAATAVGVAGGASAAVTPRLASDLVVNGSFETGTAGWRTHSSAEQHLTAVAGGEAGSRTAQLARDTTGQVWLNDASSTVVGAAAGSTYRLSAWLRTAQAGLSGALRIRQVTPGGVSVSQQPYTLAAGTWTHVVVSTTTKTGGTDLGIDVIGNQVAAGSSLAVDNITLTQTSTAARLPLLGVYNGGPATDEATRASFGRYPDLASTYYQGNQTINVAAEAARISKGIEPLITITSKSSGYTLAQIGSGAADAWINRYATAAATLDAPLLITLDHEFEVKLNQHQFGTAGPPTIADYATALTRFAARVHAAAPKARVGYWFGGYDKTKIDAVGTALAARNAGIDWYAYDPYSTDTHSAAETFEQTVTPTYTWLHARPWYHAQPSYLGEFGDDLAHGDTSVAGYMSNLRQHLANVGLAGGLLFNRNKTDADGQAVRYKIDTGTSPLSRTAFSTSLADTR